jgi:hypothetical protein
MLLENLKRVKVTRLEPGVIEGSGPEFTVNSISRDKQKLSALLNDFLNKKGADSVNNWKMSFVKGEGAAETSSSKSSGGRGSSSEVQGHPALQSLQKIFPGSKVEQVRSKE